MIDLGVKDETYGWPMNYSSYNEQSNFVEITQIGTQEMFLTILFCIFLFLPFINHYLKDVPDLLFSGKVFV